MSDTTGSYNAVSWLLDRNVEQGRGGKLAFTDTASELSYGELQKQSRRLAISCAVSTSEPRSMRKEWNHDRP